MVPFVGLDDDEGSAGGAAEPLGPCDVAVEHSGVVGDGVIDTEVVEVDLEVQVVVGEATARDVTEEVELRKGRREQAPPPHLRDYVLHMVPHSSSPLSSVSPCSSPASGTSYPLTHFVSYDLFSTAHRGFLVSITVGVEPRSYRQALHDPYWCNVISADIRAIEDNRTWSLVDLPA